MSYGRIVETGHYIWPDGDGIYFDGTYIPDEAINVFLARIYDFRKDEFEQRVQLGRKIIEDIGDKND